MPPTPPPVSQVTSVTAATVAEERPAPRLKATACVGGVSIERDIPLHEIHAYIREPDNLVWLDVQDPGEDEVELLLEEFGFHPLSVEDAMHPDQRPKIEEYKGYLFIVMYFVPPGTDHHDVTPIEVDMFVGRNYLVTVHRGPAAPLADAHARWTRSGDMIREGVGFLVYTVCDALVDSFFPVLDAVQEEMEEAEFDMFTPAGGDRIPELLRLKRTLATLRRVLAPLREVFASFLRREQGLFLPQTRIYLQDVYDHVLRILDLLEIEREMLSGAVEAYLTVLSNRLNATMKTLTVITIVVAMMGAVFGAWGMNFVAIPLANHPVGFWLVFLGTFAFVAGAVWLALRRKWL